MSSILSSFWRREISLHPGCPQYDMMLPWSALNRRHHSIAQFVKGAKRKHRWLAEEELWESSERSFHP